MPQRGNPRLLISSAPHQTLIVSRFIVSRFMEDAGANRPAHLPPRPEPETYGTGDIRNRRHTEPGMYEYHKDADQERMQIRNDG